MSVVPGCPCTLYSFLDRHSGLVLWHFLHKNSIGYTKYIEVWECHVKILAEGISR